MHALLQKLLQGVDPATPGAFWRLLHNLLALVPWWPLVWFTIACAAVGALIGWWRGRVALGIVLGWWWDRSRGWRCGRGRRGVTAPQGAGWMHGRPRPQRVPEVAVRGAARLQSGPCAPT